MRYSLQEIARVTGGVLSGSDAAMPVTSLVTDSRNFSVREHGLFAAIKGVRNNGHEYIPELHERGMKAFMVEAGQHYRKFEDAVYIEVDNTIVALQALAAYHRDQFRGKVVAVTGSNGKTIVKEWITALLKDDLKVFRSPKSFNSQLGVALSLLMLEGDEDVAVIEAGISLPGEMARLADMIKPDIGVFTTLSDAHQENFPDQLCKLKEKLLLFHTATDIIYNSFYPIANSVLQNLYPEKRLVDSSLEKQAYAFFGDRISQENAATAITVCRLLGISADILTSRLPLLSPLAMRLEIKEGIYESLIINDTYNSDLNSFALAVDYLKNVSQGRRTTVILSDIMQSGYSEEALYNKVAGIVASAAVDRFIGIGSKISDLAGLFATDSCFYPDTDSFLKDYDPASLTGHAVLLKGSRQAQFEKISHAFQKRSHTTVLEVNLDAMIHNLNLHRSMLRPGTKIMAMVKASAYGHGNYEIATMLRHQGVDYLAVAFADEGVCLRERGVTMPIVVLNADSDSFDLMVINNLQPEIYSLYSLAEFARTVRTYGGRHYPIHLKLDTGMHRLGFTRGDLPVLCDNLADLKSELKVESIFSHLAASDERSHDQFTKNQIALFEDLAAEITDSLGYRPLWHIANSSGIRRFPEANFDMVRLGLGLYGYGCESGLVPVARLLSRIVQLKHLEPGETVGYGRSGIVEKSMMIATVPIGYADGLDRRLGNGKWHLLVNGTEAPIVGRICMDTCMVDVTGIDVKEGDIVEIYGPTKGNSLAEMADILGTIPYEIMTGIPNRVKRIYVKE